MTGFNGVFVIEPEVCSKHPGMRTCGRRGELLPTERPMALEGDMGLCVADAPPMSNWMACDCGGCRWRADHDGWTFLGLGTRQAVATVAGDDPGMLMVYLPQVPAELRPLEHAPSPGSAPVGLDEQNNVLARVPHTGPLRAGRNELCACGSMAKCKRCHGA